jgi:hypothetical protein
MHSLFARGLVIGSVLVGAATLSSSVGAETSPAALPPADGKAPSFKDDVRPILATNCTSCHGGKKKKGGIDLVTYTAVMKTVKAGEPDKSRLVKSLSGKGARQMPPKSSLDTKEIDVIKAWVAAGAKDN